MATRGSQEWKDAISRGSQNRARIPTKLTLEQRAEMDRLFRQGYTIGYLSAAFNISASRAWVIRKEALAERKE